VQKCSKQVWKNPPKGLQYAWMGRIERTHKRTVIPINAVCVVDGKTVRKRTKVYLYNKGLKNIRLSLVDKK